MESLRELWTETALDVIVNSEVTLDHVVEIGQDFIRIFVEQSLQFGHFFIVIEVLLVFSVQLNEDLVVML